MPSETRVRLDLASSGAFGAGDAAVYVANELYTAEVE